MVTRQCPENAGNPYYQRPCTHQFRTSMGLPCSNKLERVLSERPSLELKDIHQHWWIVKVEEENPDQENSSDDGNDGDTDGETAARATTGATTGVTAGASTGIDYREKFGDMLKDYDKMPEHRCLIFQRFFQTL